MDRSVVNLRDVDQTQLALVGGKAANLGELARIEGIRVPPGFCITTHACERIIAAASIPDDIASAIVDAIDANTAYAVRSSATAEDLPNASFAGQHDTFLNVRGEAAILQHISLCVASLFTERAVIYRERNGIDQRSVRMAVIVQEMVDAESSGVLFTADPLTGNRKVASIDATRGLGEALVSGLVNADNYKVRDGEIVAKSAQQSVLTDAQVLQLTQLGRKIEKHFGRPQDIEWCLSRDEFHFVQSRPITTLFPIPAQSDDANHVYVSVGHQQMMTDAMKPLGISFWQLTTPRPMSVAGSRLFVDITQGLASPTSRESFLRVLGKDPLVGDALQTVIDRDFVPLRHGEAPVPPPVGSAPATIETDPEIVKELINRSESSIAALKRDIATKSGVELFDFILDDLKNELKQTLFEPRSMQAILAGMDATWWLNDHLLEWLGEKNAADVLTQSVPNNITSEMGLALLDVADAIRPHRDVVEFLRHVRDDEFLRELPNLAGGEQSRDAIEAWLEKYGARGVGEIDITRPRFRERPAMLLPILLSHIDNFEPDESKRRFEQGLRAASQKEREVLERLRAWPDGEQKADETKRMIDRVRTFAGYREYPKYGKVSRYFVYKQALLREAERLVNANVIRERDDIFYLTVQELREVVRTHEVDAQLIARRKEEFRVDETLTPPRVLTSEGEGISGAYRRDDFPHGALVGLPVSAGTVEGRARVIFDIARADLEPGDILVTPYTDPSWTPLFVAIKGLVTEVGSQMTHGAVIAREYGLSAVVGVERATQRIRDGQRIRVHGTEGFVEILEE